MAKDITTWAQETLCTELFNGGGITTALEHRHLQHRGGKYTSATYLNGDKATEPDKVWIGNQTPWLLHENGGDTRSVVDDYMEANGIQDYITAVRQLASIARLELPRGNQVFDRQEWQRQRTVEGIREEIQEYFVYCLNHTTSQEGKQVQEYIKSRGYTQAEVEAIGLGYIPSQDALNKYLLETKKHTQAEVDQVLKYTNTKGDPANVLNGFIGRSNVISIPYRVNGHLEGWNFRTSTSEDVFTNQGAKIAKYQVCGGIERSKGFFNQGTRCKDVVIVEGELDCLLASARGIADVVAIGTNSVNPDQVRNAIAKGARTFTVCLDYDLDQATGTLKQDQVTKTLKAVDTILEAGCDRVYVCTLPAPEQGEHKTDPDSVMKKGGVDALKEALTHKQAYWGYWFKTVCAKYTRIEDETGRNIGAEDMQQYLQEFNQEICEYYGRIVSITDKAMFAKRYNQAGEVLGIMPGDLEEEAQRLANLRRKTQQREDLITLLQKGLQEAKNAQIEDVIKLVTLGVAEIANKDTGVDYREVLHPDTLEDMYTEAHNLPGGLVTDYKINDVQFTLPGGQLAVFAGRTGHGKTVMLLNLLLQVARKYPDKRFIYLGYEESALKVKQYALNIFANIDKLSMYPGVSNRDQLERLFRECQPGEQPSFIPSYTWASLRPKIEQFTDLLESGRVQIKSVNYTSTELVGVIEHLAKQDNVGGVFVDYFQKLRLPAGQYRGYNSRQEELKQICIDLNDVAIRTGLPITLGAQYNRKVVNIACMDSTNVAEASDIENIVHTLLGIWDLTRLPFSASESDKQEIANKTGGKTEGMFVEVHKCRGHQADTYTIWDYNKNTQRVSQPGASNEDDKPEELF